MQEIIDTIKGLRKYSGNAQLEYINANKNDLLKEVLDYTYNPDKMYKIAESKLASAVIKKGLIPRKLKHTFEKEDWDKFTSMLDELSEKRAGDENDARKLKYFITSFSSTDVQQFLAQVLAKDLRLNLGIKKLQTIWPDFCSKPQVQLAENYKGEVFANGLYSRKFDGKRMYIMDGVAYSRSNKPCKIAPIKHILDQLCEIQDITFDGEVLYFDREGNEDFQKGISLTASDDRTPECENLYYVIFDAFVTPYFKNKSWDVPFEKQYKELRQLLNAKDSSKFGYSVLDTDYPNILIARQEEDKSMLEYLRNLYGWEGLMYRNSAVPYEFKRTKNLLKIKAMKDAEFTLEGLQVGTGRNENRLGALYIRYKDNLVGVGSGFSDSDRDLLWQKRELFLSCRFAVAFDVKVQYFEETTDADGKPSLRFPVFLCFRHKDSKEEMTVEQVLQFCEQCGKGE